MLSPTVSSLFRRGDKETAPRAAAEVLSRELVAVIKTACGLRGDTAEQCAALVAECVALPHYQQRDMAAHFANEARIWTLATGTAEPFSNRRTVGTK